MAKGHPKDTKFPSPPTITKVSTMSLPVRNLDTTRLPHAERLPQLCSFIRQFAGLKTLLFVLCGENPFLVMERMPEDARFVIMDTDSCESRALRSYWNMHHYTPGVTNWERKVPTLTTRLPEHQNTSQGVFVSPEIKLACWTPKSWSSIAQNKEGDGLASRSVVDTPVQNQLDEAINGVRFNSDSPRKPTNPDARI